MKAMFRFSISLLLFFTVILVTYPPLIYITKAFVDPDPWLFSAIEFASMLLASLLFILGLSNFKPGKYGLKKPIPGYLFPPAFLGAIIGILVGAVSFALPAIEGYPWGGLTPGEFGLYFILLGSLAETSLCFGLVQGYYQKYLAGKMNIYKWEVSIPVLASLLAYSFLQWLLFEDLLNLKLRFMITVFALLPGYLAARLKEESGSLVPAILLHSSIYLSGFITIWLIRFAF